MVEGVWESLWEKSKTLGIIKIVWRHFIRKKIITGDNWWKIEKDRGYLFVGL